MNLSDSVTKLKFISSNYAFLLSKLGINTILDLLRFFPFRYTDSSVFTSIGDLRESGEEKKNYTIKVKILKLTSAFLRSRKTIQNAKVEDSTGELKLVWFNQPYLVKALKEGVEYNFVGRIKRKPRSIEFYPNLFEQSDNGKENIHTGRLVPEYSLTEGVTKKWIRSRIKDVVENIDNINILDEVFSAGLSTVEIKKLVTDLHFPKSEVDLQNAMDTLELYEFANIQLKLLQAKELRKEVAIFNRKKINLQILLSEFLSNLPFTITKDQRKVMEQLAGNILANKLVNILIQGDVGSGKTIVAIFIALLIKRLGYQTVVLCPTTILALQHEKTFKAILDKYNIAIEAVTGQKKNIVKADIYLGTTAVIARKKELLSKVGAVIVDEQHRFGVSQREDLLKPFLDKEVTPHFINLTATPIPRTVAQAFFGDLEVADILTKPEGRKAIKTHIVDQSKRIDSIGWLKERIKLGDQIYWVCPTISDSTKIELKSLEGTYDFLKKHFKESKIGFLHGQIKNKEEIMRDFLEKKFDILLSTTVIEVGVDIPNANIIIIENAERFGLAQLHQIRGRVGRSKKESWCFLFYSENISDIAKKRLEFISHNQDGFKIAEFDLSLRGPGEIYGTMQSGIPELKVAKLANFAKYAKPGRKLAEALLLKNINQISFFS